MSEENKIPGETPENDAGQTGENGESGELLDRLCREQEKEQKEEQKTEGKESTEETPAGETGAETPAPEKPRKPEKRVTVSAFIFSAVALILAAVMVTYTCCTSVYRKKLADAKMDQVTTGTVPGNTTSDMLALFQKLFETYSFSDLDEDEMMAAVLKAYVAATGDKYAEYYTPEEYKALMQSNAGETQGIGINIINTTAMFGGVETKVLRVINVTKDSPAATAGMKIGDLIVYAGIGEERQAVDMLGYSMALKQLQGEAGTEAQFTVFRLKDDNTYETLEFSILREKFTSSSVYHHVSTVDSTVGVVKILEFNLTTPTQFCEAIDDLKSQGCTSYVLDVRYNPGGDLYSIEAVLSYFLDEGDVIIRTKDKQGNEERSCVQAVERTQAGYEGCSVKPEDIGKYRDLKVVVLCNGSTASAAELFTATFRDYGLGTIVGTKTYGKGSMQSIMPLAYFGYGGAIKLTTRKYYPAFGEGYDGIGIEPDETVELSESAAKKNIYEITDAEDNQLCRAIDLLK